MQLFGCVSIKRILKGGAQYNVARNTDTKAFWDLMAIRGHSNEKHVREREECWG